MALLQKIVTRIMLIALFIGIVVLIVALARGYRFNITDKTITSTGIISANSSPDAAKIFVNGELRGVTDQNITVSPGEYTVKITKEGFTEWEKTLRVPGELVVSIDAILFPKNPALSPLTNLGVAKALPVGQSGTVLIFVDNDDFERDGIYTLDGRTRRVSLLSPLKPVILKSLLPETISLASAEVTFASDYSEGVFSFPTTDGTGELTYLFSLENSNPEPFEISGSKDAIIAAWEEDKQNNLQKVLETYPKVIKGLAPDVFKIIAFSPDENMLLYQAKTNMELPIAITPRILSPNQAEESRSLEIDNVYVYDRKEDKNYRIDVDLSKIVPEQEPLPTITPFETEVVAEPEATDTASIDITNYNRSDIFDYIQWYPSSRHLVINEGKTVAIVQYDNTNKQYVYAGPYDTTFFGINSDWKLLVLANLNPQNNTFGDIYEIGIR